MATRKKAVGSKVGKESARSQQGVGAQQAAVGMKNFSLPKVNLTAVMVVLLIVASFFIGRLTTQVEYLKSGQLAAGSNQPSANVPVAAAPKASTIDLPGLKKLAAQIKLDTGKFEQCLSSNKYEKKVKDDSAYGATLGVSGTPSFFVNGIGLVGAQPQSKFEAVIDAELKDKSGDKAAGVEPGGRKTINNNGFVRGNKNAAIRVVEFSDFECPFCENVYPTIKALEAKYGDKLSIEYRHYPLPFHPNAQKAAEASECAGEQGKFWEMHDAMFEAQKSK